MQDPVAGRNGRKKYSEKLSEGDADSRDGAGLNNKKQRPAVEKAPQRPKSFAKINVLPAGMRHHSGEFAIAQCGSDGEESCNQPRADQQCRRTNFAADFCAYE